MCVLSNTIHDHWVKVPVRFISYIVGKKGMTIKRLQRDFNCLVTVPRSGGLVKIKALNKRSLIDIKNRLGDLVSSARQKTSKHKIILELKLATTTIQACRDLANQFLHANEGTLQFVNPAVYEIVLAVTSLSDTEVVVAKEVLAKFQTKLPQDMLISEMCCQGQDKVLEDCCSFLWTLFRCQKSVPGSRTRSAVCRVR